MVISLIVALASAENDFKVVPIIALVLALISLFIVIGVSLKDPAPVNVKYYDVMINNSDAFVEVYNNYNIVEQKGMYYTISEKGSD